MIFSTRISPELTEATKLFAGFDRPKQLLKTIPKREVDLIFFTDKKFLTWHTKLPRLRSSWHKEARSQRYRLQTRPAFSKSSWCRSLSRSCVTPHMNFDSQLDQDQDYSEPVRVSRCISSIV